MTPGRVEGETLATSGGRTWDLVVLDLMGTSIRDDGIVADAIREAVATVFHGRGVSAEDLAPLRGAEKTALFRRLVPGDEMRAVEAFGRVLRRRLGEIEPEPGAEAAVREIRRSGAAVCLASGLAPDLVADLLDRLGWRSVFDRVLCGEEAGRGRPHPDVVLAAALRCKAREMRRVVVCGDTVNDLLSGARAGAGLLVGVRTGAAELPDLLAAPHDRILDSVRDLPALLASVPPISAEVSRTQADGAGRGPSATRRSAAPLPSVKAPDPGMRSPGHLRANLASVLIVRKDVATQPGTLANVAFVLGLSAGRVTPGALFGEDVFDGDGLRHGRLTLLPHIVRKAGGNRLRSLRERFSALPEVVMVEYPEVAATSDYAEFSRALADRRAAEIEYRAIHVVGPTAMISPITKNLSRL